jgi:hypothetical protein
MQIKYPKKQKEPKSKKLKAQISEQMIATVAD